MLRELGLPPIKKLNLALFLMSLILLTSATVAVAQEDKEPIKTQYLFKDSESKGLVFSTFYGEIAPTTAFSTINSTLGKVFLTEFGFHLNRKFSIGYYLARSPNTNVVNVPAPTDPEYQDWIDAGVRLDQLPSGSTQSFLYFVRSGINMAYMHKTEKTLFWRTGLRVGFGKLKLTSKEKQLLGFFNSTIFETKVINVTPEIGVGVNLRSWWRLHLDLGYGFVIASKEDIVDPSKIEGTSFKLGFAFGNFSK